jgi:hypothetical protein
MLAGAGARSGNANAGAGGAVAGSTSIAPFAGASSGGAPAASSGGGGVAMAASGAPGTAPAPDGMGPGTIDGIAGDPTQDQETQWKVTQGAVSVDAWAWVPGGIPQLRGWIVNVQFGNQYKEFARLVGFGLMAFDPQNYHDMADWDVSFQLQAAQEAASKFGHPELANAPFLATGHSIASGTGGLFLLNGAPERLVGLAPGGMSYGYDRQTDPVLRAKAEKVPLILFRGSHNNDSSSRIPDELAGNRALHAEVAYAIQWGAVHEFGLAGNIILPMWWRSLINRYPADLVPGAAPVALKDVPEENGWLGSAADWTPAPPDLKVPAFTVPEIAPFASFTGDKSKAVWLLDSYMAHVWQAYLATDDAIHISAPPRMPDGIALLEMGAKLSVIVESGDTPSPITKLDLYDGDQKLATATEGAHTFDGVTLGPGVHALIGVATMQNGKLLTSRPTVVMGIRGTCPTQVSGGSVPITCVAP